jgi:hypothetical protein
MQESVLGSRTEKKEKVVRFFMAVIREDRDIRLDALAELLEEKGIVTKKEWEAKIKKKMNSDAGQSEFSTTK